MEYDNRSCPHQQQRPHRDKAVVARQDRRERLAASLSANPASGPVRAPTHGSIRSARRLAASTATQAGINKSSSAQKGPRAERSKEKRTRTDDQIAAEVHTGFGGDRAGRFQRLHQPSTIVGVQPSSVHRDHRQTRPERQLSKPRLHLQPGESVPNGHD